MHIIYSSAQTCNVLFAIQFKQRFWYMTKHLKCLDNFQEYQIEQDYLRRAYYYQFDIHQLV
jgi:hypothetical protein